MDRDKAGYGRKMERLPTDARGPLCQCQLGGLFTRLDSARVGVERLYSKDLERQQRRLPENARGP